MPDINRLLYLFSSLVFCDVVFFEIKVIYLNRFRQILYRFSYFLKVKIGTGIDAFLFYFSSKPFQKIIFIYDPLAILIVAPEIIPVFVTGLIIARALGISKDPVEIFASPARRINPISAVPFIH
jgi:hypothetical protein